MASTIAAKELRQLTRQLGYGWGVPPHRIKAMALIVTAMTVEGPFLIVFQPAFSRYILMDIYFLFGTLIFIYTSIHLWRALYHWNRVDRAMLAHVQGEVIAWRSVYDMLKWESETFIKLQLINGEDLIFRIPKQFISIVNQRDTTVAIAFYPANRQVVSVATIPPDQALTC